MLNRSIHIGTILLLLLSAIAAPVQAEEPDYTCLYEDDAGNKMGCLAFFDTTDISDLVPTVETGDILTYVGLLEICIRDITTAGAQSSAPPCEEHDAKYLLRYASASEEWCDDFAETGIGCGESFLKQPVREALPGELPLLCYQHTTLYVDVDGDGDTELQQPGFPLVKQGACDA